MCTIHYENVHHEKLHWRSFTAKIRVSMFTVSSPEHLADLGYSQFRWHMKLNNDIQESLGKT